MFCGSFKLAGASFPKGSQTEIYFSNIKNRKLFESWLHNVFDWGNMLNMWDFDDRGRAAQWNSLLEFVLIGLLTALELVNEEEQPTALETTLQFGVVSANLYAWDPELSESIISLPFRSAIVVGKLLSLHKIGAKLMDTILNLQSTLQDVKSTEINEVN
jgi:hypothetical protein